MFHTQLFLHTENWTICHGSCKALNFSICHGSCKALNFSLAVHLNTSVTFLLCVLEIFIMYELHVHVGPFSCELSHTMNYYVKSTSLGELPIPMIRLSTLISM